MCGEEVWMEPPCSAINLEGFAKLMRCAAGASAAFKMGL